MARLFFNFFLLLFYLSYYLFFLENSHHQGQVRSATWLRARPSNRERSMKMKSKLVVLLYLVDLSSFSIDDELEWSIFPVHHRSLQLLMTSVQRRRRSKCVAGRALVRLGYGGSGSEVGDSCYASRNISAVGFGSRLLFFASTTRNSISLRSRLANDSAISLATSWWWRPVVDKQILNFHTIGST